MIRAMTAALLTLLASLFPVAAQPRAPLEVKISDNVFLVPDKNAKRISGWLIVKAGCADEFNGDCRGIAHYLEHLLFINRDADGKSKVVMFPGGSGNGWTNATTTGYVQNFPSNPATDAANLDKLVGYFASLLVDVRADKAQSERERNVVLQEYNERTGRDAYARFAITRNLALLPGDSLGQRVIGSPEGITAFDPEDAKAFHKTWYVKSNTVLVLHGPMTAETIAPLVDKYFTPLPAGKVPAHVWHTPRTFKTETVTLNESDADARQNGVYYDRIIAYDELPTLLERRTFTAARHLVSAYFASRLAGSPMDQLIERDGLITQGGLSVGKVRDGLMRVSFWGVPAVGVTSEKLIETVKAQLATYAERGLPADAVTRIKTRSRIGRELLREEPERYASALMGWFAAHNSHAYWNEVESYGARVGTVEVQAVLAILTRPGREVIAVMTPKAKPPAGDAATTPAAAAAPAPKE